MKSISGGSIPLVSVIIATYNAESSISITLDSLSKQTFRDFEVLMVDGASTDNTVSITKSFSALNIEVKSDVDDGIGDAWNKGVARSCGRWIIFLNAGDILHPEHFARAKDRLCGEDVLRVLYCDVLKFSASGELKSKVVGRSPSLRGILFGSLGFGHPGSFVSREMFSHFLHQAVFARFHPVERSHRTNRSH